MATYDGGALLPSYGLRKVRLDYAKHARGIQTNKKNVSCLPLRSIVSSTFLLVTQLVSWCQTRVSPTVHPKAPISVNMVVASSMDDVIYHWLSKLDSSEGSPGRPKSSFTRRNDLLDTKRIDELCETPSQVKQQSHGTEPRAKISHAPQIDHNGSLPLSGDRHLMATMNENSNVPDPIPGMQTWNHTMSDAHTKVHDDGEPRTRATDKAGLLDNTSQTPVSQSHVTSNHDSKSSNPLLSNVISRGSYDRRPRYKTRPDRYVLKDTHPSATASASGTKSRKSSQIHNVVENLPKSTRDSSFLPTSTGANQPPGTATTTGKITPVTTVSHRPPISLGSSTDNEKEKVHKGKKRRKENRFKHSFRAPNVIRDRLSLPVNRGVGFLNRARVGHSGVPDLSFSGMEFLTNGVKRPSETDPTIPNHAKRVKEDEDQGRISRYFSKQTAEPLIREASQAFARQHNTLPLHLEVDAIGSAGTEPPASQLIADFVVPKAGARLLSEASLNPSRSTSNRLLRQANPPRDWPPQDVVGKLDNRCTMLVAAKTARNIAMLDQCRMAVQHAAQMVSHEDRVLIDAEVKRDYPIAKLVSGFSLQQTERAIEKMIKSENQVLAEICTLFDSGSENAGLSDAFEGAQGAGSGNGIASSAPGLHLSESLTTHPTSNTFQRQPPFPTIKDSPKAHQNTASSSDPSQYQSSANECNATSPASHILTSDATTSRQPHVQALSGDDEGASQQEGTLGSVQLPVPILDPTHELAAKSMTNLAQWQSGQNVNDVISVVDPSVSIGLNNIHPSNNCGSESNQAWHLELDTGKPQSPFLQNATKPGQPYKPEIGPSTNEKCLNSSVDAAGSMVSSAQCPSPMRAESIRNRLVPQQPYATRPLSSTGLMVSANPLTANAEGPYSGTRYTEQANSQHLSTNHLSSVNSGDRPTTPALSLLSGFSNIQSCDTGWVSESHPARHIEQHLRFDPSNIQYRHRQLDFLHATPSSPTVRRTSTAPRSSRTVTSTTPWYDNQTMPWAPSSAIQNTQPIFNSHPHFVHQGLFPKSYEFCSAPFPPSSLPFSHPNKLH
ncbi:hypothetical protein ACJ73_04031 [Blastomyces percursus]|uniref:Uncharacterized protein n=1 Tax=Blastomyces percursus TaxID=1658174 RepID=A0A1J9Q776_9EURO|nr:hypothetical protein ACJ73_04031 [Blastomyces percursus]